MRQAGRIAGIALPGSLYLPAAVERTTYARMLQPRET